MINSVLKAIDILQAFSPSEPRLTLAEIAGRLGMPKSTTHNLLATLLSCGFVEKVDADRYALGTAVMALTQAVRVNVELRDRAAPLLRDLADQCRESVYLTVLDGDYALYIYAVESPNRLMARTAVGDRAHLHCTSVGKAMLAYLPEDEVEAIVARVGLPASSERTITRLDDLREELAATRARGFAIDNQEHELRTFCIGAPIFDAAAASSPRAACPAPIRKSWAVGCRNYRSGCVKWPRRHRGAWGLCRRDRQWCSHPPCACGAADRHPMSRRPPTRSPWPLTDQPRSRG